MTQETKPGARRSVLRELGIVGYDAIESVIVAALASEAPMLLIGPHGTAKSLLLNWLAIALGLEHRHYNASMLNYDDLVGFPFPNKTNTGLEYLPTKSSIWEAESVFIDEISRTRVDMQNRLFPIIHERVVQGIPLPKLKHRWAAMNPPRNLENKDAIWNYEGSEPLDVALADRFPLVVTLPDFQLFSDTDKQAVIRGLPEKERNDAHSLLLRRIEAAKAARKVVRDSISEGVGQYVQALLSLLIKMKLPISPRRGRMLHDLVIETIAAEIAAGENDQSAAAYLALSNGLPHPAYGVAIDQSELLAAHRQAWMLAKIPANDPKRLVFAETDPVRRVALGLEFGLPDLDLSTLIQDAYAGLEETDRLCFTVALYPAVATTHNLTAISFEILAKDWSDIEAESNRRHSINSGSTRHRQWQTIAEWISRQSDKTQEERVLINLVLVLFEREVKFDPVDVQKRFLKFKALFPWNAVPTK